jgi:N-acyl-D-aspartate/D-glutamate deacylase
VEIAVGQQLLLCGNCGWSAAPISEHNRGLVHSPWWPQEISPTWRTFDQFFKIYEAQGLAVNVANLVGHGWIRGAVMGWEARPPLPAELEEMKTLTAQAMEDGVFGLSTGLSYPPGCWSEPPEVIELCKIVAKYGGFYVTHDRGGEWPRQTRSHSMCERCCTSPTYLSY